MFRSALSCGIAFALTGASSPANAAILTGVPMQGGMVMPMVSYQAGDSRVHVAMPTTIPQLTPLLLSNPQDGFDPADPWYDVLDPSRQGASFSRRYGFVMSSSSDSLPTGTQLWIRKLSGSPELKFHRYVSTDPKAFDPIFGTDGATNALYWNAVMFHPVAAAPPGTNGCTATFEIYLLDVATGQEVAGSSSGSLLFEWTNVPDGRPILHIAPDFTVAWPASTPTNWVLESAASLDAPAWTAVTNTPVPIDGQNCVTVDPKPARQFFHLRYVP